MINQFIYNSRGSSEFGLIISAPPVITAAERDEEEISIPGRDGILRIDKGRFNAVTITYQDAGFVCDQDDVERICRSINAWLLAGRGDYKLEDTYDKEYFRIASFKGPMNITNIFRRGGKGNIAFKCHPFKYSVAGSQIYDLNVGKVIFNPEQFVSNPYFKIYGDGNLELYINNKTIRLVDIDDYVEIDSESKQVFKGSLSRNNRVVMGDFPVLTTGENYFDWTEGITKVEYIPRWRTL